MDVGNRVFLGAGAIRPTRRQQPILFDRGGAHFSDYFLDKVVPGWEVPCPRSKKRAG
jgi:hypothetical protein